LRTVASEWLGALGVLTVFLILLNVIYKPIKVYHYVQTPKYIYTSYILNLC